MKNILIVTGGCGFVGSNLIEYLIKKTSFKIISLDNYTSGTKKNQFRNTRIKYLNCHTKDINVGHLHETLTGGRLHTKGYRLIPQTPEQIKRHSDTRAIKEDSSRKGRAGSKNNRAKLDIHKVRQIRQHHKDKTMGNTQMAKHFNVSLPAIEAIVYGRTWKDA